jgi:hypothetical protein
LVRRRLDGRGSSVAWCSWLIPSTASHLAPTPWSHTAGINSDLGQHVLVSPSPALSVLPSSGAAQVPRRFDQHGSPPLWRGVSDKVIDGRAIRGDGRTGLRRCRLVLGASPRRRLNRGRVHLDGCGRRQGRRMGRDLGRSHGPWRHRDLVGSARPHRVRS